MNVRKMLKHRARLSYEKTWRWFRSSPISPLIMWNSKGKQT